MLVLGIILMKIQWLTRVWNGIWIAKILKQILGEIHSNIFYIILQLNKIKENIKSSKIFKNTDRNKSNRF